MSVSAKTITICRVFCQNSFGTIVKITNGQCTDHMTADDVGSSFVISVRCNSKISYWKNLNSNQTKNFTALKTITTFLNNLKPMSQCRLPITITSVSKNEWAYKQMHPLHILCCTLVNVYHTLKRFSPKIVKSKAVTVHFSFKTFPLMMQKLHAAENMLYSGIWNVSSN